MSDEVAISHWEVDVQLARRPPSKSHAVGCEDGAARNGQYPVRTTAHWQPIHNASQRKLERRRPRSRGHRPTRTTRPSQSRGRLARNRPPPDTNDKARSKSRTSPPALARPSPETNDEARLKSRTSPLKVEDVAARNGPPPDTNDEARSKSRTSPPATGHCPSRTTRPACRDLGLEVRMRGTKWSCSRSSYQAREIERRRRCRAPSRHLRRRSRRKKKSAAEPSQLRREPCRECDDRNGRKQGSYRGRYLAHDSDHDSDAPVRNSCFTRYLAAQNFEHATYVILALA